MLLEYLQDLVVQLDRYLRRCIGYLDILVSLLQQLSVLGFLLLSLIELVFLAFAVDVFLGEELFAGLLDWLVLQVLGTFLPAILSIAGGRSDKRLDGDGLLPVDSGLRFP